MLRASIRMMAILANSLRWNMRPSAHSYHALTFRTAHVPITTTSNATAPAQNHRAQFRPCSYGTGTTHHPTKGRATAKIACHEHVLELMIVLISGASTLMDGLYVAVEISKTPSVTNAYIIRSSGTSKKGLLRRACSCSIVVI